MGEMNLTLSLLLMRVGLIFFEKILLHQSVFSSHKLNVKKNEVQDAEIIPEEPAEEENTGAMEGGEAVCELPASILLAQLNVITRIISIRNEELKLLKKKKI